MLVTTTPEQLDLGAATLAGCKTAARQLPGEAVGDFVKRIVCAYCNAVKELARLPDDFGERKN